MCVCVCVWWGVSTYRRRAGNPMGRPPFMCHQITDAQCLHTRLIETHNQTPPKSTPQNLSPWLGKLQGQRLRVDLEVVVSDGLSDLTDCHRPDGRYDQRSEVKEAIKKKVS